ncbi:EF-hand domain-containing protein [Caulobacter hibisci]|uniref:EF-hand domain-containing protein n=1 Tax=Caulobacter hibisci TaxID=2035993 RepID=A0ABS0T0K4_9CAUL|nr:EF-hand domain-containing protein [Caulobacter hibisci]MBI1685412.1 EF-hand domain-containing protein [Caulobacter hibisci]
MNRLVPAVLGLSLLAATAVHAQPGQGGPGGMRGPDADGDGAVTAAEYDAFALQRFERFDANKDGVIDAAEIDAIKKRFEEREGQGGGGFGARMLAQLAAQDADKDGKITKDEALAAARDQFAKSDANKDGKLTGDEFRMGPPPQR